MSSEGPGPWVAPDVVPPASAPAEPPRRAQPAPASVPSHHVGPPVPLRRMTPSDLLDGAFTVLKAAPANLLAVTAAFVIPVQMLVAWLQRDAVAGLDLVGVFSGDEAAIEAAAEDDPTTMLATVVSTLGSSFVLAFVCIATTTLVLARHRGHDPGLGELFGEIARRSPAVVTAWILVHLAQLVGLFALGVGALVAMAWFLVTTPVVVAERLGPVAAMRRSFRLTSRRFWPTVGIGLLVGLVAYLFGQALSAAPVLLATLFDIGGAGWVLLAVGGVMSSIITTPVVAAAATLYYLDLRVRTEGLDLEIAAGQVLAPTGARG